VKVYIEFDCDNDSFGDFDDETERILDQAHDKLLSQRYATAATVCQHPEPMHKLLDTNGNTVGSVKLVHSKWDDDKLQFARLIDEVRAAGAFDEYPEHNPLFDGIKKSTDLDDEGLLNIIGRASEFWEKSKPPLPPNPPKRSPFFCDTCGTEYDEDQEQCLVCGSEEVLPNDD